MDEELLRTTTERAIQYLSGLAERSVNPSPSALERLADLDAPLPADPTPPDQVIELLDTLGSPATLATSGGRFFGFVMGGTLPAALAANWLAGAWDQVASSTTASPVASALEATALRWLLDVLRLPPGCAGAFVTGGTMANFTALAAARHAVLERIGWDVEANGLVGAPPVTVVVGKEVHPSVRKSLGMLGLGRERAITIPVDEQGRMRVDAIPTISGPAIVCAQVGNVNTGNFDPLRAICARASESGAWVHVDGAFGLWAAAAPARAHLLDGVAEADSWSMDAHKWLNVPYDSGLAFVRDARALHRAMALTAAYIPVAEHRDPGMYTPELSRRARGVEIWAALRSLGRSGLAGLIERCCGHARRFAEGLRAAGCEILNDVVLNQVLVSFGSPETTNRVIEQIQRDGTCWCGVTKWQGHVAMRISVCNWATTDDDVDRSLAAILTAKRQVG